MSNQPIIFDIRYTPYTLPKNATENQRQAHAKERSFYDMSGETNAYKYFTTEEKLTGEKQITALEYLQKSTGIFNGNGMLPEEEVEKMKDRARNNRGNIWHGFISLGEEDSVKIDTPEKCIGMVKATYGKFFQEARLNKENIDLMCALHLDKPHHLHIHFIFWEKEPTYKESGGKLGYRRKGRIEKIAIDRMFVRLGLYIDSERDKLYETRTEAIKALRGTTDVRRAMKESDEIKKQVIELAKILPKEGRISYGSKAAESYKGRVDRIVKLLLRNDGVARRADTEFYMQLERTRIKVKNICNSPLIFSEIKKEEFSDLPKYHHTIDESHIAVIQEIEEDYRRRQGNAVLRLARFVKPEYYERKKGVKYEANDAEYKKRVNVSRRKITSLVSKFLSTFGERSEFLTRDYSNRLQEIEREIEREARNEENEREEYTKE